MFVLMFAGLMSACAREERRPDTANTAGPTPKIMTAKTDEGSIKAGKILFMQKCEYCHDAYSTKRLGGPGLKGILKNPVLPVSGKPAIPENIANQMRHPNSSMPSFVYLSDDDVRNIIAFLNTL